MKEYAESREEMGLFHLKLPCLLENTNPIKLESISPRLKNTSENTTKVQNGSQKFEVLILQRKFLRAKAYKTRCFVLVRQA